MLPRSVPFSGSGMLRHTRCSAGLIITMCGFSFSVHTRTVSRKSRGDTGRFAIEEVSYYFTMLEVRCGRLVAGGGREGLVTLFIHQHAELGGIGNLHPEQPAIADRLGID
jgi:hypothetical protein